MLQSFSAAKASLREIVFGLEDGLVSTLGAITGIATATGDPRIVVISGLVIVAVESLSMAAGTYLSNKSEIEAKKPWFPFIRKNYHQPLRDSVFMGVSYIIGGSVPVSIYLFLPVAAAIWVAVIITAISLFLVGTVKGKVVGSHPAKSGLEMMTISLTAALLGFVIGKLASNAFPGVQLAG